jgi:hypothetical protein
MGALKAIAAELSEEENDKLMFGLFQPIGTT